MLRGKELAKSTVLLSFYSVKGAVGELEREPEGAIRAMFLSLFPAENAPHALAMIELLPVQALAMIAAVYGSSFHQGYAKRTEHAQKGIPDLHAQLNVRRG